MRLLFHLVVINSCFDSTVDPPSPPFGHQPRLRKTALVTFYSILGRILFIRHSLQYH